MSGSIKLKSIYLRNTHIILSEGGRTKKFMRHRRVIVEDMTTVRPSAGWIIPENLLSRYSYDTGGGT